MNECILYRPTLKDRFLALFGRHAEQHDWDYYRRQNKYIIFQCRWCECGSDQVKNDGPMGNGKWRDIDGPWPDEWQKSRFEKARIIQ